MKFRLGKRASNLLEMYRLWSLLSLVVTVLFIMWWMQLGLWGPAVYDSSAAGKGMLIALSVVFVYLPVMGISFLFFLLIGWLASTKLYIFPKVRWLLHIPSILITMGIIIVSIYWAFDSYAGEKRKAEDRIIRRQEKIERERKKLELSP